MMALQQRVASALCAALLLSACAVDGAGLWGSKKTEEAKVAPVKAAPAAVAKAAIPSGDGHNTYWCARGGGPGGARRPSPRENALYHQVLIAFALPKPGDAPVDITGPYPARKQGPGPWPPN